MAGRRLDVNREYGDTALVVTARRLLAGYICAAMVRSIAAQRVYLIRRALSKKCPAVRHSYLIP